MKRLALLVVIEFEDEVEDTDIHKKEVAQKIADALEHECDSGMGIAPEDSETFTKRITVSESGLELAYVDLV